MIRPLRAGASYFLIVFAIAFALGALRVTFVVPAIGPFWATLAELPLMLAVAWAVCAMLVRRSRIDALFPAFVMGAFAFFLLIAAETAFSILMFGESVDALLASYRTAHGALGLSGQLAFGAFPVVQHLRRSAGSRKSGPAAGAP